ncbi:Oxidoreductase [Macleaya cordata]|uniref:Oxidoreductase n=1 Tax=Macleaya cordata TaxID=56857 RepID=A0A200QCB4_MACCD|nr:Oxidoreductase [Macleaya cordata]
MAEKPIRFGILGCAEIARKVSRAITLCPNTNLYAVASRSIEKAKNFASSNGFPSTAKIYGSYEALLDDPDVDAVYVPLPTSLHLRWAVLVAEKKKHLLLEKPVALNVQEFDRIIEACESNGVQFMDGTMWMHHPRTAKMREFLSDSERFGQLKSVKSKVGVRNSRVTLTCAGMGPLEIARKVSRAITLCPNTNLYAVASRSIEKAKNFASSNGFPSTAKIYGSYEALLDDPDVDAVYVPLPTSLHLRWAVLVAEKKKHLLLEKPVALNVQEFDRIIEACESNGVQFMDGTMWMHHPRTAKMREFLSDSERFGQLKSVHSIFTYAGNPDFLKNDIRVKPDLDALGALGDVGWYCIRSILWAADYELPKSVTALRGPILNDSGVILACGSSFQWEDGKVATFQASFLTNLTMDVTAVGTKGTLHLHDFVIPFEETSASFTFASESGFNDLVTGWVPLPSEHVVTTDLPQEAQMVKEFAGLVRSIKESCSKPEKKWPSISRKTQLVLDAVKASIDKGFEPVEIVS